jgi:hypothetical protein
MGCDIPPIPPKPCRRKFAPFSPRIFINPSPNSIPMVSGDMAKVRYLCVGCAKLDKHHENSRIAARMQVSKG